VSRAAPELVQNLFQTEVPEIYDGTVVIRAIAREAGERTKIAVMSKDKDVDSVGACVGMKGMRVQSIIRELRGEKIDIIEYHEDPATFAEKALQPAKVARVTVIDSADKHLEVIVDDSQLSLAIGKKGQNVRLAAKLLGWKIDIKSEEEKRQEVEQQMSALVGSPTTPLEQVPDLGEGIVEKLSAAGVTTVEGLADMTPEQLEEIPGIGPKTIEKISLAVSNYFASLEAAAAAAADTAASGSEETPAASETAEAAESSETAEGQPDPSDVDPEAKLTAAPDDLDSNPDDAGQAGGTEGLSEVPTDTEDSVRELADTGQALEADAVDGEENVPPADETSKSEVHVHGEEPHEGEK
jgi:N utilization substance protein A